MTPEEFFAAANVSRETMDRLLAMDAVLLDWSSRHNLIARSTIPSRWSRHYLDSVQLARFFKPTDQSVVDFGSGAGFPGLVLAALLAPNNTRVTLVESRTKKCAFLAAATDAMGLDNVEIANVRIEELTLSRQPDVITARALARLDKLLAYSAGIQGKSTRYYFLKGQDVASELNDATKYWNMDVERHLSCTSEDGVILEIGNVKRVGKR